MYWGINFYCFVINIIGISEDGLTYTKHDEEEFISNNGGKHLLY